MQNYHKNSSCPKCSVKIDITKAFDYVNWEFLEHVLQAFSLPSLLIHWIMSCITSPFFSIIINEKPNGYFIGKEGLRYGDSLSPYLSIMCMEVLSKLMDKAASEGVFDYHAQCKALSLTHLVFADDLVIS